jgi:hypothetical protein
VREAAWGNGLVDDTGTAPQADFTDRTRNLRGLAHWETPSSVIDSAAYGYRTDRWASQPNYVEVWIEKDALVGVISGACNRLDVPYFSCRGYTSQSELWGAARRLIRQSKQGHDPIVIHLGDHDPSGIDMTRDIGDRLALFGASATVRRIALNMDQVDHYQPPPNPAKLTDARAEGYISRYGPESWELDALDPTTLDALITSTIEEYRDAWLWERDTTAMEADRALLTTAANRWGELAEYLREHPATPNEDDSDGA